MAWTHHFDEYFENAYFDSKLSYLSLYHGEGPIGGPIYKLRPH